MNEQSFAAYNALMNELFKVADCYYAMMIEFGEADMEGFEIMAKYESKERWKLGDKIREYIMDNRKKPTLTPKPAPPGGIPTAADALKTALAHEQNIIKLLNSGLSQAAQGDPGELYYMGKIKQECMDEYNEIAGYETKMGIPGNSVYHMDKYLKKKYMYYQESHNPCGEYEK